MIKCRTGGGIIMDYGEMISTGTILDDRYEIKKVIRKNKDIIVYEGWHRQIEESFLIQELTKGSPNTEKILSRARRLSDFSELTDLFQVCDQFSIGEKVYIIIEYPKGQCLQEILTTGKKLSARNLAVMFRKLLKSLEKLEEAGIRDLPVDAATLYLQEDGSLYLFPETDRFMPGYMDYAYQVCELMYQGLSGQKPTDKAVRLLFDEMITLEEMNLQIDGEFCRIVDEGLKICEEDDSGGISLDDLERKLEQWWEKENSHGKRKRYWITGGLLSAMLLCAVVVGVYLKYEEKIRFWGIQTETVLLEPGKDMNRKEYQKALQVIEERVKKLVGSSKYLVKDDDGIIRILMPAKVYKESYTEKQLQSYLSRPLKLSVAVGNGSVKFFTMTREQYVTLDNEDIVKVEETDTEDRETWSTEETVNKMLNITVTDEAAARMKEKLGKLQEKVDKETDDPEEKYYPLLCLDGDKNDYDAHIEAAVEQDDWHVFTVPENAYFKMAKDLWKEETFDTSFDIDPEISEIHWEKKITSILKNWVDESEIPEPSVILEYDRDASLFSEIQSDKGDYYHNIGDLAQRLETLDIAYALGNVEGDFDRLAVKVRQKDMSDMVADILGSQEPISIQNVWRDSLWTSEISLSTGSISGADKQTEWKTVFECNEDMMKDFAESAIKSNGYAYLYGPLKYCIGKAKLTEVPQGKELEDNSVDIGNKKYEITFTETDLGSTGYFTKGMNSLADMLANISDQYNLNDDFKLSGVQYNENGRMVSEKKESRTAWEVIDHVLRNIEKAGRHEDNYAEFQEIEDSDYKGEKELYITLHMDTQEEYADTAAERVIKLWNACDLEASEYSFIRFCIGEYEEYPIVNIRRSSIDDEWVLSVRWSDEICGERFKEKMYEELKNKTFLQNGVTEEEADQELEERMEEQ